MEHIFSSKDVTMTMYHVRLFVRQAYGQFRYVQRVLLGMLNRQELEHETSTNCESFRGGKRAGLPPAVGLEMVEQYLGWSYWIGSGILLDFHFLVHRKIAAVGLSKVDEHLIF